MTHPRFISADFNLALLTLLFPSVLTRSETAHERIPDYADYKPAGFLKMDRGTVKAMAMGEHGWHLVI